MASTFIRLVDTFTFTGTSTLVPASMVKGGTFLVLRHVNSFRRHTYFLPVVVVLKDNEFAVVLIRLVPAVHNLVTPLLHAHTL